MKCRVLILLSLAVISCSGYAQLSIEECYKKQKQTIRLLSNMV